MTNYEDFIISDQKGPILQMNGKYMATMETYDIWLKLSKSTHSAASTVKYELKVLDGVPPDVDIE